MLKVGRINRVYRRLIDWCRRRDLGCWRRDRARLSLPFRHQSGQCGLTFEITHGDTFLAAAAAC